jgi:hypothetical protein
MATLHLVIQAIELRICSGTSLNLQFLFTGFRLAELLIEDSVIELEIGKESELVLSPCKVHHSIVSECERVSPYAQESVFGGDIWLSKQPKQRVTDLRIKTESRVLSLVRLPNDTYNPTEAPGKVIDSAWIESGLLDCWRNKCHSLHGTSCDAPLA